MHRHGSFTYSKINAKGNKQLPDKLSLNFQYHAGDGLFLSLSLYHLYVGFLFPAILLIES